MWPLAQQTRGRVQPLSLAAPTTTTAAVIRRTLLVTLVLSASVSATGTLPYIPTTILIPGSNSALSSSGVSNGTVAYIFSPTDQSADLLALDISGSLKAGSISTDTLTSGLPFADGSTTKAFLPTITDNGTLAVFAGQCASSTGSELWTYVPPASKSDASTWTKFTAGASSGSANDGQAAPYFLGGGFSFSAQLAPVTSQPITYAYGGMCPWANMTGSNAQSGAVYSQRMLKVSPPSGGSSGTFSVGIASAGSPNPVAEAGFTFTQLTPSISNRSGVVTQQASYVVMGGHTQQAFVNMSTAAVWTLPEETWNYVNINPPGKESGPTELAVKDTSTDIDSRSGHTTVMSEDGNFLVILGGWVSDVTQAASPQLAIIEIGASLGEWQWSIPASQPSGPGIYGHGAALLPGNVMMVYGGHSISGTGSKRRRQAGKDGDVQMFFNLTSQGWSNDYTNPNPTPAGTTSSSKPSSSSDGGATSKDRKIGLGVGLGIGIPIAILTISVVLCIYRRRQRDRRYQRESDLRGLAQDASRFLYDPGASGPGAMGDDEMLEQDGSGGLFPWNPAAARRWFTGGQDPYSSGRRSLGYETLRGGAQLYPTPPAPTAPAGRPRNARGLYQPATNVANSYEFGNNSQHASGGIHPIYEADEDEHDGGYGHFGVGNPAMPRAMVSQETHDDPFVTPPSGSPTRLSPTRGHYHHLSTASRQSSTPSPEDDMRPQGQVQEVQDWVLDVDAADAMLAARISPHNATTTTTGSMATPITPTTTTTLLSTTAPTTMTPCSIPSVMPAPLTVIKHSGRVSPIRRGSMRSARGAGSGSPVHGESADEARTNSNLSERSYSVVQGMATTAMSSRSASIRSQPRNAHGGGAASGAGPMAGVNEAAEGRLDSSSSSEQTWGTARSNPNFSALQAEGPGLLLQGDGREYYGVQQEEDAEEEEDFVHIPGSPSKNRPRRSWLGSLKRVFSAGTGTPSPTGSTRGESPTHENEGGSSDYESRLKGMGPGGTLQRRKQGREAWEGVPGNAAEKSRVTGSAAEDEWDIERAVENRQVQVMFTVPRERLRVVNAEVEREEEAGTALDTEKTPLKYGDTNAYEIASVQEPHSTPTAADRPDRRYADEVYDEKRQSRGVEHHDFPDNETEAAFSERTVSLISSTTFHLAEAVRLERPRTRVLEMVESIESRSGSPRSDSP